MCTMLTEVKIAQSRYDEAEAFIQRALGIAEKAGDTDNPDFAELLSRERDQGP